MSILTGDREARAAAPLMLPDQTENDAAAPRADAGQRVVLDLRRRRHRCASRAAATAATLVHPPVPDLPVLPEPVARSRPRCRAGPRSSASRSTPISGCPDFEPPYVIANVALAEDAERPAHDEHRRLRARRRAHRPGGRGPLRAARRRVAAAVRADRVRRPRRPRRRARCGPSPRPPSSDDRFEHRAVLSGIGRSAIGRRLMVDPLSLTVDACLAAVADAGLTLDDIDGLSTYPGPAGGGHERGRRHRRRGGAAHPPDLDQRRRRPARTGRLGHRAPCSPWPRAVPPRAVLPHGVGVDVRRPGRSGSAVAAAAASGCRARSGNGARPFGAMSAANWIGMNANQYLHRYGATREMLGWIALNGRRQRGAQPAPRSTATR